MKKIPWVPKDLLKYEIARKVLGVMTMNPPSADQYENLFREKVLKLLKEAQSLEPIDTYLMIPLNSLNDQKDPEQIYAQMMNLSEEWVLPISAMLRYLKKQAPIQDIKEALRIQEGYETSPIGFRKELKNLTLEEFLEMGGQPAA